MLLALPSKLEYVKYKQSGNVTKDVKEKKLKCRWSYVLFGTFFSLLVSHYYVNARLCTEIALHCRDVNYKRGTVTAKYFLSLFIVLG